MNQALLIYDVNTPQNYYVTHLRILNIYLEKKKKHLYIIKLPVEVNQKQPFFY